jgi:GNAT superfamily N-acetyltransferase
VDVMLAALTGDGVADRAGELVALLRACVDAGASVSFMPASTDESMAAYWHVVADEVRAGTTVLHVAMDVNGIVGTVHIADAPMPNGPHRAEVRKLLVHPSHRRGGLGAALMRAAEPVARSRGRWLLVLDTETGGDAERLYRRLGWREAGSIPDYALKPDGSLCATTFFSKDLR